MKLIGYIIAVFFCFNISYSQTYIYKHFDVDEGLPSSEVYDIYQDKQGYIWFATDRGLSRYNGYEFENFTIKNGLPDNTILDFYPQKNGQIWCFGYHSREFFYFDEEFNGFKSYKYNHLLKEHLKNGIVKSLVLEDNGALYIGGYGIEGYIKITLDGKLIREYVKNSDKKHLNVNFVYQPKRGLHFLLFHNHEPIEGSIIIKRKYRLTSRVDVQNLNDNDIIFIDEKLGMVTSEKDVQYFETKQNPIGIKRISDSTFFVGYYGMGAEIRNTKGKVLERFILKKSVTNFLIDKEGSYWFSTLEDGVFQIKNPTIKVRTNQHISSLVKDYNNNLFAGLNNGSITQINKDTITTLYKGLSTDDALVSLDPETNQLYGYSDGHLVNYTSQKKISSITVNKLPERGLNSILANSSKYFYTFKNDSIKMHFSNYKRLQDVCIYNNQYFIGTSAGLCIFKNDSIIEHQPKDFLKSRIDDIDIEPITNTLYMSTQGNGVVVYNNDVIYNITKEKGLTNNIIGEIHIENDSTVWACSNTGLNRIIFKSNSNYRVETITKNDGLISNDIDDIEIINDTVWVATKKGLCYFKKQFLDAKKAPEILSLKLKKVTVNKILIDNRRKLKYNQNSLDFTLQAISHRNAEKIKYLYRLKELDTSWTATTNRVISFPNLSSGDYTFEVKASLLNKTSKHLIDYRFKIAPPFWKSWWFYSICSFILLSLLYLFFKIRVLTYNKDVIRELIRLLIKKLKRKEQLYRFRSNGEDFKIPTHEIQYVNSQGNYLDIITNKKKYTIRCKIGDFINTTPDSLEYLRVHRSYIIRIDKITSKGKNWVVVKETKIPVGETYFSELEKIQF